MAVCISHAHADHFGLLKYIDAKIPVHISETADTLIETIADFIGKETPVIKKPVYFEEDPREHKIYKTIISGDIEITPNIVDHAVPGAFAFLVKGGGKSMFYTGDFRSHGKKSKYFYRFVKYIAPSNVDYLLMEGSTLSREYKKTISESALETQFLNLFDVYKGINLIYTSSQNIDRLVSIYRACRKRKKIFVIDIFVAAILLNLAKLGYNISRPAKDWGGIRVFYPYKHCKMLGKSERLKSLYLYPPKAYHISKEKISKRQDDIVMLTRPSMTGIEKIDLKSGNFIFSQWAGYKNDERTKKFISRLENMGFNVIDIHTTGHADTKTLQKMVGAVLPKELIPIHTFEAQKYPEIFSGATVRILADGEAVS